MMEIEKIKYNRHKLQVTIKYNIHWKKKDPYAKTNP